jgi:hypothetical protein
LEEYDWKTDLSYKLSYVLVIFTLLVSLLDLFYPPIFYNETLASKAQVIGQDVVNIILAAPALALSLYYSREGSVKSRIILLGVQAYLAYTFLSYGVLFKLNQGFLFYTTAFGISLYSTLLNLAGFKIEDLEINASEGKRRSTQYAMVFVILIMIFLWSPDLVAYYIRNEVPSVISEDGFHTLIFPFQDFSIILPLTVLAIWLIRKDDKLGYILTPVILVKVFSIAVAVIGMIVTMSYYGTPASIPQVIIFAVASLVIGFYLWNYFKNIEIKESMEL